MTAVGFHITRLSLTGDRVRTAEIQFANGLNVIVGPSDTGKTFVFQCLDYMLGASRTPKEIPEAARYELLLLEGRAADGATFALERSLRGGDFRLRTEGSGEVILKAKHDPEEKNTVSAFLLQLSGLIGRRVRVDRLGKTRSLSFRDLAHLIMVDETRIISEKSPLLSGQFIFRTVETAVFRLLLGGIDDSSVIAAAAPKVAKERDEAKAEVVAALVERVRSELSHLGLGEDLPTLEDQRLKLDAVVSEASQQLSVEQASGAELERRRQVAWVQLRQAESRKSVLSELQRRFGLLAQQYDSDLRRLVAIAEAGLNLGQMREERCPVCGATAEHHEVQHRDLRLAPEDVASACRTEAGKIRTLIRDLQSTIAANEAELGRLTEEVEGRRTELEGAGKELQKVLQPRLQAALRRLAESQESRDGIRRAIDLCRRIQELELFLAGSNGGMKGTPKAAKAALLGADDAEVLSREVEALLRTWHFPNLDRVTFSDSDLDLVVSGRRRASHGKGVRAITHAAFNLALLAVCRRREMPHPGFVVIDSPLVVYREPDVDEGGFTHEVKDAFYRTLASSFSSAQVLILENEEPPADLDARANVIRFTGTERGRSGFIPRASVSPGSGDQPA